MRIRLSRRAFLGSSAAPLAALAVRSTPWPAQESRVALVIRGGTIFDGTGTAGVEGDVADFVAFLREIDATARHPCSGGCCVIPAFTFTSRPPTTR